MAQETRNAEEVLLDKVYEANRRLNDYRDTKYDTDLNQAVPTRHVHVEWTSSDCDGRMSGEHVSLRPFHQVVEDKISAYNRFSYEPREDDEGLQVGELSVQNEEGGSSYRIYECEFLCERTTVRRDHSAEAMGY